MLEIMVKLLVEGGIDYFSLFLGLPPFFYFSLVFLLLSHFFLSSFLLLAPF